MPEADPLITIATRHQAHIERLKAQHVSEFRPFLERMERRLRERLAGVELTEFARSRLEDQISYVGTLLRGTWDEYHQLWQRQVREFAVAEAEFEHQAMNMAATVQTSLPTEAQLVAAVFSSPLSVRGPDGGRLLDGFFKNVSDDNIERIEGAIRQAFAQGETTGELLKTIRGTRANNFKDGLMERGRRSAEMMTRTALQHASSQAREAVWHNNRDIISRVRWSSTLDSRTTAVCRSLDGQTFELDKGPRPPIHPGCRSTTVAVLRDKFAALSEERTRRARDSQDARKVDYIPAKITYYEWLKQQPAAFQDSVVGPTRGRLLRKGGLSAKRFAELQLHKNFEPATLAEMKELAPTAFEKAGLG